MNNYISKVHRIDYGACTKTVSGYTWDGFTEIDEHTHVVAAVYEKVLTKLSKYSDSRISLISIISSGFCYQSGSNIELELQFPNGLVMEVDCGLILLEKDGIPTNDIFEVGSDIDFLLEECEYRDINQIANQFSAMRLQINKEFAKWSLDNDAHVDLIDFKMKLTSEWQEHFTPAVEMIVNCLDEALIPSKRVIEADNPEDALKEVMALHKEIKTRTKLKIKFGLEGADGTIDLITLRSLLNSDGSPMPVQGYLNSIKDPSRNTNLESHRGHLYLVRSFHDSVHIFFNYNYIRISDQSFPSIVCSNASGKPITDYITHRFLTSEVIIKTMTSVTEYGRQYIEIFVEQPKFYYCRGTGRFWATE